MSHTDHVIWVATRCRIVKVRWVHILLNESLLLCTWWTDFTLQSDILPQSSVLFRHWGAWSIDFRVLSYGRAIWNIEYRICGFHVSFQWLFVLSDSVGLLWFCSRWSHHSFLWSNSKISLIRVLLESIVFSLYSSLFGWWRVLKLFLSSREGPVSIGENGNCFSTSMVDIRVPQFDFFSLAMASCSIDWDFDLNWFSLPCWNLDHKRLLLVLVFWRIV